MSRNHQKRILVLRYRFIGDTILMVPFLRNLRRAEPDAFIAWMVAPGSSDVVKGIPYVDELIYWDPVTIHADSRGRHRTLGDKFTFIRDLRRRGFDTAYVLKRSFSSAVIARLSGASKRVGFATEGRSFLLTTAVPYRQEQHEVQSFLDVLRADGIPVTDDHLETWISPEEARQAEEILGAEGMPAGSRLLALHPFASSGGKSWPLESFATVAGRLQESSGLVPVVFGGERDVAEFAAGRDRFPPGTIDLVGKCGLRVSMAVLKRCRLYIGNDSGVMHLAAASGVPLVALFGPTSPQRFGPWGANVRVISRAFPCAPCRQKFFEECEPSPRGKPSCLEAIGVDEVIDASRALLEKTEAR